MLYFRMLFFLQKILHFSLRAPVGHCPLVEEKLFKGHACIIHFDLKNIHSSVKKTPFLKHSSKKTFTKNNKVVTLTYNRI